MLSCAVSKLKDNHGESITETLVALLIASFALIMLAGAITTSVRIVSSSKKKIGEYYNADKYLVEQNSTVSGTESGSMSISATVTIAEGSKTLIGIGSRYTNKVFSDHPVTAYSVSAYLQENSTGGP